MSTTEIPHAHVTVADDGLAEPSEAKHHQRPGPPRLHVAKHVENGLEGLIFFSRWLQAPLYLGLIVALVLYSYRFGVELVDLCADIRGVTEEVLMISVLSLVDITMVANLIVMVVIGGYATFVSRINVNSHEDNPSWLEHIGPSTLKIKLSTALVSISGIHLLKAFINIKQMEHNNVMWMVIIHAVFLFSAFGLTVSERVMHPAAARHH